MCEDPSDRERIGIESFGENSSLLMEMEVRGLVCLDMRQALSPIY